MSNTKYYNVPPIKNLEFAANFIAHYFKFQEHVEIEKNYLGRSLTNDELKMLLIEFMVDQEHLLKERNESGS
ncbi:MAG: hypothetical protein HN757_17785 [Calditrichaeota bacterium]|jgi:hypothetical protein|nr:hypothetical protein [Calditrichota bacterium]